MSLMSRVRAAGNASDSSPGEATASLARLRVLLDNYIPADKLARMAMQNPILAEAEVRSACERIFSGADFDAMGEVSPAARNALVNELIDGIFGFGAIQPLLADDSITEVMVNGVHSVYFERDGVLHRAEKRFASEDEIRALIDRIVGPLGRRIDESAPMVSARLSDGSRVHAVLPPVSLTGPLLSIRRFPAQVLSLADMEESGSVERRMGMLLRWAVVGRVNIAVSGGTGTGKTTLLNALSCEIPSTERIITIEDSAELRFLEHPHVVRLEARPVNAEGSGEITIRDLVITALRMRPDRIVVGECRGAEALDMLQAMNTGHDGSLTTLHANSPRDALLRLITMVRYAAELPVDVIERQVCSAIELGVQVSRDAAGMRYVSQAVEYCFDDDKGAPVVDVIYERAYGADAGRWHRVPSWMGKLVDQGAASREEVREWKRLIS